MKKEIVFALFLGCLFMTSCKEESSYAVQLKAEKALIKEYISRMGISVIEEWPEDSVFAENQYLLTSSGLYIQLLDKGQGTDTVEYNDIIVLRYKKYGLTEYADTLSYWTTSDTPYPIEFNYGVTSDLACSAWHEAISYMKRMQSQARIIVPSKIGFSDDSSSILTPYGYEMKITGIKK